MVIYFLQLTENKIDLLYFCCWRAQKVLCTTFAAQFVCMEYFDFSFLSS